MAERVRVREIDDDEGRRLYHKSPAVTDLREVPDWGHSLIIDHGWREVAQTVLDWLNEHMP